MKINGKEIKEKKEKIEPVFTISESQIKGTTMCKNHLWEQLGNNEAECQRCPTVITYDPKKYKIIKGRLLPSKITN